jgi:hypothetical protein
MNKPWQPYALHILDAIARIRRIVARGNIIDDVLYDVALRNLPSSCINLDQKAGFTA